MEFSLNTIRVLKSIRMRLRQSITQKGRRDIHTYMVLVEKPEVLTRPKHVQLNNIKMDLKRKWISRHELDSSGSQQ